MKVVHFSPIYIDGWGYQDNLLPKYFKIMGYEVCVISPNILPSEFRSKEILKGKYYIDDVEIRRINVFWYLSSTFFATKGLYKNLKEKNPQILFHHGIGLTSLFVCGLYRIFNPECTLYVDNHSDFINHTKSKIWFVFYSKFILRILSNLLSPFVRIFYGVSPSRCDYLETVFKIKKNKIEHLPIGADTLAFEAITLSKDAIKAKYKIPPCDYIVISGGKMGKDKGTDSLIRAVEDIKSKGEKISLVLFGSINDADTQYLAKKSESVLLLGWCNRETTFEILKIADVAVWPIHHTTLIEDSIACLTPIILRKTRTTEHLINGNGIFIDEGTFDEIKSAILEIKNQNVDNLLNKCISMREKIDYRTIVNMIINDHSIINFD